MDITDNSEVTTKCYKNEERLLDNLNIVYNESSSMFLFWNKYQIFVYEDHNFESVAKVIVPEFLVSQVIVSNNYLVCLDCSGNVQITPLKFKNAAQKRFKSSFQPREHGIITSIKYNPDSILSIKSESGTFFLCLNRISAEFLLDNMVTLKCDRELWKPQSTEEKYILRSHAITKEDFDIVKELFNVEETVWNEHCIVIISPDKYNIYGCLFSPKMKNEEIELVKLYATPSEICDLKILETESLNILIGVKTGTVIKLALKEINTPELVHINVGLSKFLAIKSNDTLIYTDGITMWKSEHSFSENDIKFSQFFIMHVKDFVKFGDQIICTTYSNLFYTFSLEDDKSFIKSLNEDEYYPADKFLKNSEYLTNILEEVEKNNKLLKKIYYEEYYITALSLSNRQDIMDTVIDVNGVVYENYEDVFKDNNDVTLTEELYEYFKESFYFLIKMTASVLQQDNNYILSNLLANIKIHITLSSEQKILKTTSFKLTEQLKKVKILIPLQINNVINASQIKVEVKLVTNIPGAHDAKHIIWTILYRKQIVFNSEHFIKTNTTRYKHVSLKDPEGTIEDLIQETTVNHHGPKFRITDISKHETGANEHSMYVKLPTNYRDIFKNKEFYLERFNSGKANFLQKQLTSEEFLKSNSNLIFEIGNDKVKIEIINDFSSPLLKIACDNMKIAYNMRYFFASLLYNDFKNYQPVQEHVNYAFYTTTENMQKAVKKSIVEGSEDILSLSELFQKSIIGALPL